MRRRGSIESASGLGVADHVCWSFDEPDELLDAIRSWAVDGLDLRQRLIYVAGRPAEQLRADLAPALDVDRLVASGALQLLTLDAAYPRGPLTSPEAEVVLYGRILDRAVADGFHGVRAMSDVTGLVRDPAQLDARVRWEQRIDAMIATATAPVAALCGYHRRTLGDDAIAALCSVHPLRHDPHGLAMFALHPFDDGLLLEGVLEGFGRVQLERVLHAVPLPEQGDVLIDVHGVEYASAACAAVLYRFGERMASDGRRLVLRGSSTIFRRVWDALGFDAGATLVA